MLLLFSCLTSFVLVLYLAGLSLVGVICPLCFSLYFTVDLLFPFASLIVFAFESVCSNIASFFQHIGFPTRNMTSELPVRTAEPRVDALINPSMHISPQVLQPGSCLRGTRSARLPRAALPFGFTRY